MSSPGERREGNEPGRGEGNSDSPTAHSSHSPPPPPPSLWTKGTSFTPAPSRSCLRSHEHGSLPVCFSSSSCLRSLARSLAPFPSLRFARFLPSKLPNLAAPHVINVKAGLSRARARRELSQGARERLSAWVAVVRRAPSLVSSSSPPFFKSPSGRPVLLQLHTRREKNP